MDTEFMWKFAPLFAEAAITTISIAFLGIVLSALLGLAISLIRYEKVHLLTPLSGAYIELSRNTPLLVQLFFLYFGLPKIGVHISGTACAVLGLTFLGAIWQKPSAAGWKPFLNRKSNPPPLSASASTKCSGISQGPRLLSLPFPLFVQMYFSLLKKLPFSVSVLFPI